MIKKWSEKVAVYKQSQSASQTNERTASNCLIVASVCGIVCRKNEMIIKKSVLVITNNHDKQSTVIQSESPTNNPLISLEFTQWQSIHILLEAIV